MVNNTIYQDLVLQKVFIEKQFPVINLNLTPNFLEGFFTLKDKNWKKKYHFFFKYKNGNDFKVVLRQPYIKPNLDFHMFSDSSLCLYFFNDFSYNHKMLLSRDILPKCTDWVNNYELWLVNGKKWLSVSKKHGEHRMYLPYLRIAA